MSNATPELLPCPICRGVGFHPYGFYAAIEYPSGSSAINISPEKCRSCNNGIIGLPTPDTPLREAAEAALSEMQWLIVAVEMSRNSHDDPFCLKAHKVESELSAALAEKERP